MSGDGMRSFSPAAGAVCSVSWYESSLHALGHSLHQLEELVVGG